MNRLSLYVFNIITSSIFTSISIANVTQKSISTATINKCSFIYETKNDLAANILVYNEYNPSLFELTSILPKKTFLNGAGTKYGLSAEQKKPFQYTVDSHTFKNQHGDRVSFNGKYKVILSTDGQLYLLPENSKYDFIHFSKGRAILNSRLNIEEIEFQPVAFAGYIDFYGGDVMSITKKNNTFKISNYMLLQFIEFLADRSLNINDAIIEINNGTSVKNLQPIIAKLKSLRSQFQQLSSTTNNLSEADYSSLSDQIVSLLKNGYLGQKELVVAELERWFFSPYLSSKTLPLINEIGQILLSSNKLVLASGESTTKTPNLFFPSLISSDIGVQKLVKALSMSYGTTSPLPSGLVHLLQSAYAEVHYTQISELRNDSNAKKENQKPLVEKLFSQHPILRSIIPGG